MKHTFYKSPQTLKIANILLEALPTGVKVNETFITRFNRPFGTKIIERSLTVCI